MRPLELPVLIIAVIFTTVLIITIFNVLRCDSSTTKNASRILQRYENDEVICYSIYQKTLQCRWKDLRTLSTTNPGE